jgi:PAS domain S-box-containing protein
MEATTNENKALNKHSILGRLLYLYLFILICGGISILVVYQKTSLIKEEAYLYHQSKQRMVEYCHEIDSELSYAAFLSYENALKKSVNTVAIAKGVWQEKILARIDSLKKMAHFLQDETLENDVHALRRDVIKLEDYFSFFLEYDSLAPKVFAEQDKKYHLQLNRLRKKLNDISNVQQTEIKNTILNIQQAVHELRDFFTYTLVFIIFSGILISFLITQNLLRNIRKTQIYLNQICEGNLQENLMTKNKELKPLTTTVNQLKETMERLKMLAEEVGTGNFETQIRVFGGKGILGKALTNMRQSLQYISIENKQRNWINEGYAKFSEILRNSTRNDIDFYDNIISNIVTYLELTQGGIFALTELEEEDEEVMVLQSAYAFGRNKYIQKMFTREEGLVGQAWRERDKIYITEIPDNYADVTSGLGKAKPDTILIVPLITNNEVYGILELASFSHIPKYKIDFIERIGESIATTIARLQVDTETKTLLDDSQYMARLMQEQEEEMHQSMEELLSAQEKIEQNAKEMEIQLTALSESFLMMEMDIKGRFIKVNQRALELSKYQDKELMGQHYSILAGKGAEGVSFNEDWNKILRGDYIQGEFIRYTKDEHRFWIYEVMYPLYDADGNLFKVCLIAYDITKQKEQEQKIREQLSELQMSKRDVVNRIREVEGKSRAKINKLELEYQQMLQEKDKTIEELRQYAEEQKS